MAGETNLLPVIVGGLLTIGGGAVGGFGTLVRDAILNRQEKSKRKADKFEELVVAVYEFDQWVDNQRVKAIAGNDETPMVSPFAKVQAISAIYFPQFDPDVIELDKATSIYRMWMSNLGVSRVAGTMGNKPVGFIESYHPYNVARETLLKKLKEFAHGEFQ
jgi:hypothetical protein